MFAVAAVALSGCGGSSVSVENRQVENQQALYVRNQPPPFFNWSLERHILIETYRARNNAVATYSYVRSPFTGKVLFSCPSIGFPIPYSTQLTNPNGIEYRAGSHWTLPQPEPNGLYPPATALGTWVFCANTDGTVSPSYQEPNVETYLQPMKEVQEGPNFVLVASGSPSLRINTKP